jgi:hypothetical protein
MNVFLTLLEEPQQAWEGEVGLERMRGLLARSERHAEVREPEGADVILLVESVNFKSQRAIPAFEQNGLLRRFAEKVFTLNCADAPAAFLPGLYVSLPRSRFDGGQHRAIPYPWGSPNPLAEKFRAEEASPVYLASFRGARSHAVRERLMAVMRAHPELGPARFVERWFDHTAEEHRDYLMEIARSKFVLCPRGIGTSSHRLFEVMAMGRVPVIISDEWVPTVGVDWDKVSLQVRETEIETLPAILLANEARWPEMAGNVQWAWAARMAPSRMADTLLDAVEELRRARNGAPRLDEWRARWRSHAFFRENGWGFWQRVGRRVSRVIGRG